MLIWIHSNISLSIVRTLISSINPKLKPKTKRVFSCIELNAPWPQNHCAPSKTHQWEIPVKHWGRLPLRSTLHCILYALWESKCEYFKFTKKLLQTIWIHNAWSYIWSVSTCRNIYTVHRSKAVLCVCTQQHQYLYSMDPQWYGCGIYIWQYCF